MLNDNDVLERRTRMVIDIFNSNLTQKLMDLGIAIPADDQTDYVFSDVEEEIIYRNQFITSKEEILDALNERCLDEQFLNKTATYYKTKPETLIELYSKLKEEVKDRNLFDAPEGLWRYDFVFANGSLDLILLNETGYIDECLNFMPDEINESYVLLTVCTNEEEVHG